jgi:hypothetical protein
VTASHAARSSDSAYACLSHACACSLREVGWQTLTLQQLSASPETEWELEAAAIEGWFPPQFVWIKTATPSLFSPTSL